MVLCPIHVLCLLLPLGLCKYILLSQFHLHSIPLLLILQDQCLHLAHLLHEAFFDYFKLQIFLLSLTPLHFKSLSYQLSLAPSFSQSTFPSLLFMSTFYLASRTNSVGVFSATSSLVFSLFRTIPSSVAMTHCFC